MKGSFQDTESHGSFKCQKWSDQETSPKTSQYNRFYLISIRLNLYLGFSLISYSLFNRWLLQFILWLLPYLSHFSLKWQTLRSSSDSFSWTTDFLLKEVTQLASDPSSFPYSTQFVIPKLGAVALDQKGGLETNTVFQWKLGNSIVFGANLPFCLLHPWDPELYPTSPAPGSLTIAVKKKKNLWRGREHLSLGS